MDLEKVIKFIKELMIREGVTARELSQHIGVSEVTIGRWLNGNRKMPYDMVNKCLVFFGYSLGINYLG